MARAKINLRLFTEEDVKVLERGIRRVRRSMIARSKPVCLVFPDIPRPKRKGPRNALEHPPGEAWDIIRWRANR